MHSMRVIIAFNVFVCCLLLTPGAPVYSQIHEKFIIDDYLRDAVYGKKYACTVQSTTLPMQDADSTLDVTSYELWMDWYQLLHDPEATSTGPQCTSRIRITLQTTSTVDSIKLNAQVLVVDSVHLNGIAMPFTQSSRFVSIGSDAGFSEDTAYVIEVWYSPYTKRRGLYAYSARQIDSTGIITTNAAYTFSEPTDAQFWYPCNDQPHDKALFTVHVRVPASYQVVSNGRRTDSVAQADTSSWQTWHCPDAMPTYLFSVNASQFMRLDQVAVSVDGDSIPISNYYWPQDHAPGQTYSGSTAFNHVPAMFAALEQHFGAYPFSSYGHVVAAPINIGGMEHQTMTTIARRWLKGDLDYAMAHELAHHWSGDHVTCGTWADIWLNEGGASWSEALWMQYVGGADAYRSHMNGRRAKYLTTAVNEPPIYNPPMPLLFNEATTYCKAAWVYHMAYMMCGDSFMDALKKWYAMPLRSSQTWEFSEFLKQEIQTPAVAWDTFFSQWLLQPYHPFISAVLSAGKPQEDGTYEFTLSVEQIQDKIGFETVYEFPLEVRFDNGATTADTTMMVRNRSEVLTLRLPFIPTNCILDPLDHLLCEDTVSVVTGVREPAADVVLTVLGASPLVRSEPLMLYTESGSVIRVYATDGRMLAASTAVSEHVVFNTSSWPTGVVSIVAEHHGKINQAFQTILR